MMLVSKDLKKCLALMTLGATLMTGCASGPGTGFTRFWPKKDSADAVAQDEALAAKWRARIDGKTEDEIIAERDRAVTQPEAEPQEKSRLGFLRFPWNKDKQTESQTSEEVRKLQERLAQLEAEKYRATQDRRVNLTKRGSMEDPFLKAESQNRTGNPFEAYARTNSNSGVRSSIAPSNEIPTWAQQPADRIRTPAIASTNPTLPKNEFAPDFDRTLKNLGTEIERETASRTTAAPFPGEAQVTNVTRTAPAIPETNIATRSDRPNRTTAPASQQPEVSDMQPKLDRPIADEESPQHPLANLKTVAEQRQDWARLEVQGLMKHARIQARANQFKEAMQTALAAEQLANNATLEFAENEQPPAELIRILKYHMEQLESGSAVAAKQQTETAPAAVAQVSAPPQRGTESKLPNWPHGNLTASREVAAAPGADVKTAEKPTVEQPKSTVLKSTQPPQWPAQNVSLTTSDEPEGRYIEARPGVSSRSRTQLITSSSIYSSENLRWAKLESERATLKDSPVERSSVEDLHSQPGPPAPADEDDPFAEAFGSANAEQEALIEDVPAALLAPEIPAEGEPMASAWDDEVFGIPVRRIALLALATLMLLAAIIHRRRNNPEQI